MRDRKLEISWESARPDTSDRNSHGYKSNTLFASTSH